MGTRALTGGVSRETPFGTLAGPAPETRSERRSLFHVKQAGSAFGYCLHRSVLTPPPDLENQVLQIRRRHAGYPACLRE